VSVVALPPGDRCLPASEPLGKVTLGQAGAQRSAHFLCAFVARLESAAADARVSTVERYAGSLGCVVQYHLVPVDQSADEPIVVFRSSVSKGV
jgi:hypothetical protein